MLPTMLVTKLTTKGQTTIPSRIRKALRIEPGDSVVFTLEDNGKVSLRRAEKFDAGFLKLATESFTDWSTPEADEAFRDL
ncbi:MAG: AbrB/MazE/SpoVT family DNA-binding domain-containing protein [Rhodospirillales bacterium]|nr:AbrB/MazE/SpoVT family DNA-binding domain-containing protein [Rhodospirillales bacterium]MDH3916864.1 AbrB/MazE/SpoVT family DNA-binding domain-containing protein [Rhodospirillales bacterium]MDH3969955.1 AbrB/MazE/SpoVT family DNA-binding domain-containing protein [Rhodospirillales bacterium]